MPFQTPDESPRNAYTAAIRQRPSISINQSALPRPHTTFNRHRPNSIGRSIVQGLLTVQQAQEAIQTSINGGFKGYLRRKWKQQMKKGVRQLKYDWKLQASAMQATMSSNPEQSLLTSINAHSIHSRHSRRHSLLTPSLYNQPQPHLLTVSVVSPPFLINYKQKVTRLLALKQQSQQKYMHLSQTISQRVKQKSKDKYNTIDHSKIKGKVASTEWDQSWREDTNKEKRRYRMRLGRKHESIQGNHTIDYQ